MKRMFTSTLSRILMALVGALGGAAIGLLATLAIVVGKARAGYYLFNAHDIAAFNLESATVFVGIVAGAVLAYRMPVRWIRAIVRGLIGLIGGALVGVALGYAVGQNNEWAWSGAVMVGAIGLLAMMAYTLTTSKLQRLTRADLAAATVVGLTVAAVFLIGFMEPEPPEIAEIEPAPLPPLSAVDEVVFIVGDAGATKAGHTPLLRALGQDIEHWSARLARDSAVTVVYTGDLVYPVGVRDRSDPAFPVDSSRLWNQIDLVGGPMARRYKSAGLLIPGNHDWGNTSDESGLDNIMNLSEQVDLAKAGGWNVGLFPKAGGPGPVVRDVRDNIRFVIIDTHWFLRTRSQGQRAEFLTALEAALNPEDERHVIVASHHPYQSAGPHGAVVPGYYTYGVDYLLSKTGAIVQDLNSVVYEELLDGMRAMFERAKSPPLIFAGGHDHSLQVLERRNEHDPAFMLVSGSGSKISAIRTLPNMHYGAARPGYMMLLLRKDGAVDLFVVAGEPDLMKCEAEADDALNACMTIGENSYDLVYGKTIAEAPGEPILTDSTTVDNPEVTVDEPTVTNVIDETPAEPAPSSRAVAWWMRDVLPASADIAESEENRKTPPVAVPARVLYFTPDSVTTTTGTSYPAALIKSIVLGDLNRHLWDVPVRLPVLNLDTLGGGVTVDEITGGMQTLGLRFEGRNGITYQFRSIVKDPTRGLDTALKQTAQPVVEDQAASQFPLSAMVVAELLDAVDVLVAKPVPVVMPNDDRLGDYRPFYAGRVGWIEVRPNEGDDNTPGFAGARKIVGGHEIYEELREDPTSYMDTRKYLRARYIDFLVSDWDRHADNWRWARFEDQGRARWEPIPRDRDWAFTRSDGIVSMAAPVVFDRFVGFSEEYPPVNRLATSAYRLDHRMLSGVSLDVFRAEAQAVRQALSDETLRAALAVLPPSYQAIEGDRLFQALQKRRGFLDQMAEEYHTLLSKSVHIHGYDDVVDTVQLESLSETQVRVRAWRAGEEDAPYFDQVLDAAQTGELKLYLEEDTDVVIQPESVPLTVTRVPAHTQEDEYSPY